MMSRWWGPINCASFLALLLTASAYIGPSGIGAFGRCSHRGRRLLVAASATVETASIDTLTLTLEKPLGMMLEEVQENTAAGVYVKELGDSGSAVPYAGQILGARLASIDGVSVVKADFDSVMELMVKAESSTVTIEFVVPNAAAVVEYAAGTPVVITVQQLDGSGTPSNLELNAKVGDNLRQVLLDNEVEVYQGLKQKLGNCGGAGQCTFCAVDFLKGEGWADRSDYEDGKLKRFPTARLACLNSIQGPAMIQKTQR